MSSGKNTLKWLLLLPSAFLAFFIPFLFFYFFTGFMLEKGYYTNEDFRPLSYPTSFLYIFFFTLFSSFFSFVHTGSSIAPSNKRTVAIILSLLLTAPLIFYLYIINFVSGTLNYFLLESPEYVNYAIISGIIGIVVANFAIKMKGLSKYMTFFFIFLILVFGSLYFF